MAEITLIAEAGRRPGSAESRRLRRDGRIPAVVYGHGQEPLAVSVAARELRAALSTDAGLNALLSLRVDGGEVLTMARDIQRHPVRGTVTHVDFQVVNRDEEVGADVTLSTVGEAVEVAHADGMVDQQLFSLAIRAKPGSIPPVIEVDVSGLTVGSAIRVGDLTLPAGVSTDLDPETVVVAGATARTQTRAEEAAEAEAAEEAAGGAPAAAEDTGAAGADAGS